EDNQSADYASYIVGQSGVGEINNIQLQKMMKGKIASVYPAIGNYSQGFSGSFSPADMETAMQLIHMYATQPRKDEEAFAAIIEQQKGFIANRTTDPAEVFNDTVMVTMANYHPRIKPATLEELAKVKLDRSYDIYKQTFNTFNGHTFIFVGNIDSATFIKYAETYLGSLPGKEKPKKWKDLGIKAPKGKINKTVKKGIEPKASVELKMNGKFDWSMKNRMEFNALINILRIKLRENLREDKGGVYGVQVYNGITRIPEPTYTVTVGFGCAPENVDSLLSNVLMEIEKLKKNGPEEKDLVKVKETMKRERETSLKENRFWLSAISQYMQNEDKLSELGGNEYINLVDKLDAKTIKALANKYLTMENFAQFILLPENQ
ncbi:MAG TPA: insulinase family protein, partial [Bacteroidia bacterium]|nr:insulinase family protein [Bacteroidia bacterium]